MPLPADEKIKTECQNYRFGLVKKDHFVTNRAIIYFIKTKNQKPKTKNQKLKTKN